MFYTLIEALAALICLIPACILLHRFRFHSRKDSLLYSLFAIYLAAVYHLTGLPTVLFITFDVNVNLVPTELFRKELVLSLLNIAMFVPLGFFLPLLCEKYRSMKNTMLFGLAATVAIELAQLLTYRATDINDVITNSIGCWLGYVLFRILSPGLQIFLPPETESSDLLWILLLTGSEMFFLQPLIASLLYSLL